LYVLLFSQGFCDQPELSQDSLSVFYDFVCKNARTGQIAGFSQAFASQPKTIQARLVTTNQLFVFITPLTGHWGSSQTSRGCCGGEELKYAKKPDLTLFTDSELKILAMVKKYFKDFNAKRITDFSHDEKGYKETLQEQIISYE